MHAATQTHPYNRATPETRMQDIYQASATNSPRDMRQIPWVWLEIFACSLTQNGGLYVVLGLRVSMKGGKL